MGLCSESKINLQVRREVNEASLSVMTRGRELPVHGIGWRETPASRHSELRGGDRKEARKAHIVKGGRETPRDRNKGSHLHTFTEHTSKFYCK